MAEEAEQAVREVHHRCDDDDCDNPPPHGVKHQEARADKQIVEIRYGPSEHIADIESGRGRECARCI